MTDAPLSLSFNPAGIELDRRLGLSRQLYQALRLRVLDGRLASGTRLPASRDLAAALAISRNSVVRAYDQLYAEGFIEGRVGDGTYVAQLPQAALPAKKLSTKISTGFSTGLSTTLSTNWLDLPVDPSRQSYPQRSDGTGEKQPFTQSAERSAAGISGRCSGVRSVSIRGLGQAECGFLAQAGFAAAVLRRPGWRCAPARDDCCVFAQFPWHAVHG
ncbi:UNVERIFIED_ORG: DNA-binding transcriptional regulator YhcF (GntR family) [Pseudomonas reinekei]|nr:DNA-binding transcriptional regulator YhcF (GntR family) [Pseudomonas reinekei]